MVVARALETPYQVEFWAGQNSGMADTAKKGLGGSAGLRPHELLEAALASCLTITASMALMTLGLPDVDVEVAVTLDRQETVTRFHYEVRLGPPADEAVHEAVSERLRRSPVMQTLTRPLIFEAAQPAPVVQADLVSELLSADQE